MSQFGDLYSQYYDLLYRDKDYAGEVDYVESLIKNNTHNTKTILDLGCGTGRHDELLVDKGYKLHGVDISEEMLNIARKRLKGKEGDICFTHSDISNLHLNQKFDAVISLFHVMSYQSKNDVVDRLFDTVKNHLRNDGVFIFDFWYGPGVLTDLPTTNIKRLENENIKVTRTSKPEMYAQSNTVDVDFDIKITQKNNGKKIETSETHTMRYFFDTELEMFCMKHGFKVEAKYNWLDFQKPSFESWNVVWIIRKEI